MDSLPDEIVLEILTKSNTITETPSITDSGIYSEDEFTPFPNISQLQLICHKWNRLLSPEYHCNCVDCIKKGKKCLFEAIQKGHVRCFKYGMIYYGSLLKMNEVIEMEYQNKLVSVCQYAVIYGQFEILKFINNYNLYLGGYFACFCAVKYGQLEILKWLYKIGYLQLYWDPMLLSYSILFNHFDILKWLYENGCPYDANHYKYAIESGSPEIVKWLYDHHFPFNPWTLLPRDSTF